MRKFSIVLFIFFMLNSYAYAESKYSNSLSRMEREWLHCEFNDEDDEKRIERLEEKIFGTIHDIDTSLRYKQLQKAFNARKNLQAKHRKYSKYSGVPTGVSMSVDDFWSETSH